MNMKKFVKINSKNIDLIVYDFDGVLTDNKVLVFDDGREAVFCNRSDGWAVRQIKASGIPQIILSTEKNRVVEARAKKLEIEAVHGVDNKGDVLLDYCGRKKYSLKRVLYIGNDVNDLEAMKMVGYPLAPQDAHPKIIKVAKGVLKKNGGQGVVRELFDNINLLQGDFK